MARRIDCGSRKFQLGEDGYAEIRSTLKFDYESGAPPGVRRGHGSLLDQFDSHLSPLRTGMVSIDLFRLRAVRIGDGEPPTCGIATIRPSSGGCTARDSGESLPNERCVLDS